MPSETIQLQLTKSYSECVSEICRNPNEMNKTKFNHGKVLIHPENSSYYKRGHRQVRSVIELREVQVKQTALTLRSV